MIAAMLSLLLMMVGLAIWAVLYGHLAVATVCLVIAAALTWAIARSVDDPYAHPRNQVTNGRCKHCNHALGVADIRTGTCQRCGMPIWDKRAA